MGPMNLLGLLALVALLCDAHAERFGLHGNDARGEPRNELELLTRNASATPLAPTIKYVRVDSPASSARQLTTDSSYTATKTWSDSSSSTTCVCASTYGVGYKLTSGSDSFSYTDQLDSSSTVTQITASWCGTSCGATYMSMTVGGVSMGSASLSYSCSCSDEDTWSHDSGTGDDWSSYTPGDTISVSMYSDGDIAYAGVVLTIYYTGAMAPTPMPTVPGAPDSSSSFESDFNGWTTSTFNRISGSTSSSTTGPNSAYSGSYYIYAETSSPNSPGTEFTMHGNFGTDVSYVSFAYHMYGSTMGTAELQGSDDDGSTYTTLWSKSGNYGNTWSTATVSPCASYQVLKFKYTGGSSYTGDFALDYVSVTTGSTSSPCVQVTTPTSGSSYALTDYVPVAWTSSGLTGTSVYLYKCDDDSSSSSCDSNSDCTYMTSATDDDGSTSLYANTYFSTGSYYICVQDSSGTYNYGSEFDIGDSDDYAGSYYNYYYYDDGGRPPKNMTIESMNDELLDLELNMGDKIRLRYNYDDVDVYLCDGNDLDMTDKCGSNSKCDYVTNHYYYYGYTMKVTWSYSKSDGNYGRFDFGSTYRICLASWDYSNAFDYTPLITIVDAESFDICVDALDCNKKHTLACTLDTTNYDYDDGRTGKAFLRNGKNTTIDWSGEDELSIWNERCLCQDLYYEENGVGCAKEQNLELSMAMAIMTLIAAAILPPLLFALGKVDSVAMHLRKQFINLIGWMRKETTWAHEQEVLYQKEQERLKEENKIDEVEENEFARDVKKAIFAGMAFLSFVLGFFLFLCVELLFSTFLVASSMNVFLPPTHMKGLVDMISRGLGTCGLDFLGFSVSWFADLLTWFDFTFNVEAVGVTCEGAKAPVYLLINFLLIGTIIVMFDSNFYFVARAGQDFKFHHDDESKFTRYKTKFLQSMLSGAANLFKKAVKVLLTNFNMVLFMPYYSSTTEVCDANTGGMDAGIALFATLVYWFTLFPLLHLVINTFVFGEVPLWVEKKAAGNPEFVKDLSDIREQAKNFKAEKVNCRKWCRVSCWECCKACCCCFFCCCCHICRFCSGVCSEGCLYNEDDDVKHQGKEENKDAKAQNDIELQATSYAESPAEVRAEKSPKVRFDEPPIAVAVDTDDSATQNPLHELAADAVPQGIDKGIYRSTMMKNQEETDLLAHNPGFWHDPRKVWKLFVTDLGHGNIFTGFYYYTMTMLWKAKLLLRLTFGLWNDELLEHFDVKQRGEKLDLDVHDDDEKYEALLGDIGDSHAMIWQLLALTPLLTAGELFNKSIIFVPRASQKEFTTPYWIRRAQCICYLLQYIFFLLQQIIPAFFPYVSRASVTDDFFDDDANNDDSRVSSRYRNPWSDQGVPNEVGQREFFRQRYAFGSYWVTSVPGYEAYCWSFFFWAVVAIVNSVLEYIKKKELEKLFEAAEAKAREEGDMKLIHHLPENNVGVNRRVVLSGHNGAQVKLMGEYKLMGEKRYNDAPIFALRSLDIREPGVETSKVPDKIKGIPVPARIKEMGEKTLKETAYLYRTPVGGDGDGRWRVARDGFYGPSSAAAIETTMPCELPTDPGVKFNVRAQNMGEWAESAITAVDPSTIAPPALVVCDTTAIAEKLETKFDEKILGISRPVLAEAEYWGTYVLQDHHQFGYPLYIREGDSKAFLYRSPDDAESEGGRWRIAKDEDEMVNKRGSVKSLAPAVLPNTLGIQFAVCDGEKWQMAKMKAAVPKEGRWDSIKAKINRIRGIRNASLQRGSGHQMPRPDNVDNPLHDVVAKAAVVEPPKMAEQAVVEPPKAVDAAADDLVEVPLEAKVDNEKHGSQVRIDKRAWSSDKPRRRNTVSALDLSSPAAPAGTGDRGSVVIRGHSFSTNRPSRRSSMSDVPVARQVAVESSAAVTKKSPVGGSSNAV